MKRAVVAAAALGVIAAGAPSRATHRVWESDGTVLTAVLHPGAARLAYEVSPLSNGLLGYVIELPSDADGTAYTLTRDSGLGFENLDAYFYESIDTDPPGATFGKLCPTATSEDSATRERGTICPGSLDGRWLVVVMRAGTVVDFTFSYLRPH